MHPTTIEDGKTDLIAFVIADEKSIMTVEGEKFNCFEAQAAYYSLRIIRKLLEFCLAKMKTQQVQQTHWCMRGWCKVWKTFEGRSVKIKEEIAKKMNCFWFSKEIKTCAITKTKSEWSGSVGEVFL